MKAGVYLRVSTDEQTKAYGLDAQKTACYELAEREGYSIVKTYEDDGISGTRTDRDGIQQAIRDAQAGSFDVLLTYNPERIGRKRTVSIYIVEELAEAGVNIHYVLGGLVDTSTVAGLVLDTVSGMTAELYLRDLADKTHRGKREAVKRGSVMCGPNPPYGYIKLAKDDFGIIKLDLHQEHAQVVKRIFREYLDGGSITGLVRDLNQDHAPKDTRGNWSHPSVRRILDNELYTGKYYWLKTQKLNGKDVPRPREDWIGPVDVPPIISDEIFRQTAIKRKATTRTFKGSVKHTYLMRGRVTCAECEKTYYCKHVSNRWFYYKHPTREKRGNCQNRVNLVRDNIDGHVKDYIIEMITDQDFFEVEIAKMKEAAEELRVENEDSLNSLERRLVKLDGKRKIILDGYEKGVYRGEEASERLEMLTQEEESLKRQRSQLYSEMNPETPPLEEYLKDYQTQYQDSLMRDERFDEYINDEGIIVLDDLDSFNDLVKETLSDDDYAFRIEQLDVKVTVTSDGNAKITSVIGPDLALSFKDTTPARG